MRLHAIISSFLIALLISTPTAMAATCPPPTVAVLDSGVDVRGLKSSLWINTREIPANGIDDDGNGLIDDVHGWNFYENSPDLSDHNGHGTHVAGLIRRFAEPHDARMMVLKYVDGQKRHGTGAAFRRAISYALEKGARVIHISGGGYKPSSLELALLRKAEERGVTVIAASGNKSSNAPHRKFFPAAYGLKNIISVGATDDNGQPLPTTNLIPDRENFFEKGFAILSLLPGEKRGPMTGTSQAAGIFTGKYLARISSSILPCNADM